MPLVNVPASPPEPAPAPGHINANITAPEYRHSLVDGKKQPLTALLTHIEGSSWTTDYYSQVIGADEELSPYQPGQMTPYQQYLLIKNYELKLQGSLSISQDETSGEFTITGTALTYPQIVPNVGDAFIADVGDGRAGQFSLTSVSKKTIMKEACYEVNFIMTRYADEALVKDINARVVQTTYFQKDFLTYGQNPLIVESAVNDKKKIEDYISTFLNRWLGDFYSSEYRTMLVPGQGSPVYDNFLVKAMLRMFDRNDHPLIKKIREINCDGERMMDLFNIWTAMMNGDDTMRDVLAQKMWLIPSTAFNPSPYLDGVYFSGISKVVYPNLVRPNIDTDYVNKTPFTGSQLSDLADMDWELASVFVNNVPGGFAIPADEPLLPSYAPGEVPYIHPITLDDYYVFSSFFYAKSTVNQSKIELLVNAMLANQSIDKVSLFTICEDVKRWGRLEKFYYLPVLLILLKVSLRTL